MLITEIRFLRVKCQPSLSSPKAGTMSLVNLFGEKCDAYHHDEDMRSALYLDAAGGSDLYGR